MQKYIDLTVVFWFNETGYECVTPKKEINMAIFERLKNTMKETEIKDSTKDNPISQGDLVAFREAHPDKVFQVEKSVFLCR